MTEDDQKARVSAETFDDFLSEQGMLEETEEVAIKRVLAWQIAAMAAVGGPLGRRG